MESDGLWVSTSLVHGIAHKSMVQVRVRWVIVDGKHKRIVFLDDWVFWRGKQITGNQVSLAVDRKEVSPVSGVVQPTIRAVDVDVISWRNRYRRWLSTNRNIIGGSSRVWNWNLCVDNCWIYDLEQKQSKWIHVLYSVRVKEHFIIQCSESQLRKRLSKNTYRHWHVKRSKFCTTSRL